jgi:hypothetical protein
LHKKLFETPVLERGKKTVRCGAQLEEIFPAGQADQYLDDAGIDFVESDGLQVDGLLGGEGGLQGVPERPRLLHAKPAG